MSRKTAMSLEARVGRRFGRLVLIAESWVDGGYRKCRVRCDCGTEKVVHFGNLMSGVTVSCGCRMAETAKETLTTHGHSPKTGPTPEYRSWAKMKRRCLCPDDPSYGDYGGRGISVCDRWVIGADGKTGAECFISDMGPRPGPGYTIERVANHLSYSPENCVWATQKEQCRNTRRNRMIPFGVGLVPLVVATEVLGISYDKVKQRLDRGWSVERALTE